MSSTNFTSGTLLTSSWLNAVNSTVYNNVFPNSGGGTTNFLRADGTWAAPSGGGSSLTLQQVIANGSTSTNNANIGGVGIGNQINAPTGITVYGITSTANYVGLQSNFLGSSPYTVLLSSSAFIPYSNAITGSVTNSGIALGASGYQWSSIGVAGSLYWNNTVVTAPDTGSGGDATKFLNQKGSWVVPSGTGTGLTSVGISVPTGLTTSGSPLTSNGTIAISWSGQIPPANLASSTPNTASFVRGDGVWSNTLTGNASFGGVGIGNQINAPTGITVYGITSTANYVGMQSNFGGGSPYTVLLSGAAFIPYPNNTIALGASAYQWSSLGVAGSFYWGNTTITAPNTSSGSSTLFLNQQGSWVTPSGSGSGLTSVGLSMPTGFSVSNTPLTSNGTIAVSWSGYVPTANLGSGSASSGTYLRGDGTWSAPTLQAVCAAGSTYSGGITIGGTSTFNSYLGIGSTSTGPTGTAYGISTSTSVIGIGNSSAQTYLYGTAFIPSADATLSLGSDSYRWQNIKVSGGASYFGAQSTFSSAPTVYAAQSTSGGIALAAYQGATSATALASVVASTTSNLVYFGYGSPSSPTTVGVISTDGTNVNYGSGSDRRLKTNIETYTASGAFIDSLLPRTFTWISTNTTAVGFIADELQAVCPGAVHGAADAVDENEKPIYQTVDASTPQMIANIVAELQSLRARLKAANIQ